MGWKLVLYVSNTDNYFYLSLLFIQWAVDASDYVP
jgi:hypothetical protein